MISEAVQADGVKTGGESGPAGLKAEGAIGSAP